MKSILITISFLLSFVAFSQNDSIYNEVDVFPRFPSGIDALSLFIKSNFKYPNEAAINEEQGTVWVQFVVWQDSTIGNIKVVRSVSESLDREAIRVVSLMLKWIPGKKDGIVVPVYY